MNKYNVGSLRDALSSLVDEADGACECVATAPDDICAPSPCSWCYARDVLDWFSFGVPDDRKIAVDSIGLIEDLTATLKSVMAHFDRQMRLADVSSREALIRRSDDFVKLARQKLILGEAELNEMEINLIPIECEHRGCDHCCQHPKNTTPECHDHACPLVRD